MFSERTVCLVKRVSTRDGHLHLTSNEVTGETGVKVKKPLYAVYSLAKEGEASRLENWRSLLSPGREVKFLCEAETPVVAMLRVGEADEKVWDSEPVEGREWVVFWTLTS